MRRLSVAVLEVGAGLAWIVSCTVERRDVVEGCPPGWEDDGSRCVEPEGEGGEAGSKPAAGAPSVAGAAGSAGTPATGSSTNDAGAGGDSAFGGEAGRATAEGGGGAGGVPDGGVAGAGPNENTAGTNIIGGGAGFGGEGGSCPPGSWNADGSPDTQCVAWTDCVPGERVSDTPSAEADRGCEPCPSGAFSVSENAPSCDLWTECADGYEEDEAGTATTDRTCKRSFPIQVSVDSNGNPGDGGSYSPSISSDGRFVAFESDATDLVANDTNGTSDVFVHDIETGTTTRVSVASSGNEANGHSSFASISADGHVVAFLSSASNLVAGDTNDNFDVFVHDTQTGTTKRVSVDSSGNEADGGSDYPSISAYGRFVAFESYSLNLVAGDTNWFEDIFVHDTQTGTTRRVSVDSSGNEGNLFSYGSSISADGRFVAYWSNASNLVPGDTNDAADVFLHDTHTGATTRVSIASSGNQGDGSSLFPSISSDGRFVAFASDAGNLVAGDTNLLRDIFVHDTETGSTTRLSVDSSGSEANGDSGSPTISLAGRLVVFSSDASNLVASDTNSTSDVFVHDIETGSTTRLSVDSSGSQGDGSSLSPSISSDGRFVAFESEANNLVDGELNDLPQVFVAAVP